MRKLYTIFIHFAHGILAGMRICTKCKQFKPNSEFFVRNTQKGNLHVQCKLCYKQQRAITYKGHYHKYRDLYLKRAKERRQALKIEFRTNMLEYITGKSCVVCQESDIRTLDFDHIDPSNKLFNVSQAVKLGYNWQQVEDEIKKCRILCANCHRKHTAIQGSWYKAMSS